MLKCLLAPAAFLYRMGVTFRHRLFDWGILKSEKFDIPIICIGNITVGGTGKTPMAEMLIAYMSQMHRVALLSRGYGRRTKGYLEVRTDSHYRDVGDEPLQIKFKFPDTVVAVCEKRVEGIRRIRSEHPEVDFIDLAMRFMDIRKRVYTFPHMGEKAYFIAIPTSAGTGSEPDNFGWSSTPSVTWNIANSSANRYMDPGNGEYSGYTFDGSAYDQNRILWIRFNNSEEFIYTFDGLQAGSKYELSMKYGWHNNGAAPNLTVGVYEKSTGTKLGEEVFKSSTTKRTLKESSYEFTVPNELESNGEFYISIKNDANGDAMAIIADLAVIDTDETGTSIDGIEDNSNGEGISIIPEDGGITIAADNKTSVKAVKIYSVTGMVVRTVNLNGSSKFVPLEAGLYIVGGKTVAVK